MPWIGRQCNCVSPTAPTEKRCRTPPPRHRPEAPIAQKPASKDRPVANLRRSLLNRGDPAQAFPITAKSCARTTHVPSGTVPTNPKRTRSDFLFRWRLRAGDDSSDVWILARPQFATLLALLLALKQPFSLLFLPLLAADLFLALLCCALVERLHGRSTNAPRVHRRSRPAHCVRRVHHRRRRRHRRQSHRGRRHRRHRSALAPR